MISGWVAGTVRARALARRRLGAEGVRRLAGEPALAAALEALVDTPYGHDVRLGQDLAQAQRAVWATLLWNLRVLAGWLPREGVVALRAAASWFEVLNAEDHLRGLAGEPVAEPYRVGALGTVWPRLATTRTAHELREVLATSSWGDPGSEDPAALSVAMRVGVARRVAATAPEARGWVAGATLLLLARDRFVLETSARGWPAPALSAANVLLGPGAMAAPSLRELAAAVPRESRAVLARVQDPAQLWAAEAACWRAVETEAFRLLRRPRFEPAVLCGAVALLAVDAWRTSGALEVAARGGVAPEVLDALA